MLHVWRARIIVQSAMTNQRWNNHIKTQGAFHLSELAGLTIARPVSLPRNRLFPGGLDEKPSPSDIKFRI